jgi:hypothetical protein
LDSSISQQTAKLLTPIAPQKTSGYRMFAKLLQNLGHINRFTRCPIEGRRSAIDHTQAKLGKEHYSLCGRCRADAKNHTGMLAG